MEPITLFNTISPYGGKQEQQSIFKGKTSITGTVVDKTNNSVTVDFGGEKLSFSHENNVKENIGDTINFKVEETAGKVKLSYKAVEEQKSKQQATSYNATLQQVNQEDDEELTIQNYNRKVNEAMDELLKNASAKELQYLRMFGVDIRKMSMDMVGLFNKSAELDVDASKEISNYIQDKIENLEKQEETKENNEDIFKILKEQGIVLNKEQLNQVSQCLDILKGLGDLDESQSIALLKSNENPNFNAIYNAYHMPKQNGQQVPPSMDEATIIAFVQDKVPELSKEEAKEIGTKFIQNQVPITASTVNKFLQLTNLRQQLNDNSDFYTGEVIKQVSQGEKGLSITLKPDDYSGLNQGTYNNTMTLLEGIEDQHINYLVEHDEEINVSSLREAHNTGKVSSNTTADTLTYRRQINELRLQMTYEAASIMEKKGINIDTAPLQQLVDELSTMEENYLKDISDKIKLTDVQHSVLKDIVSATKSVRHNIIDVASTISQRKTAFNLEELARQPVKSYEASETEIRSDLGDSFTKIKSQIPHLLEELGIEPSEDNVKLAGGLIKNNMPVTKEAIEESKMIMHKLEKLTKNLHPLMSAQLLKNDQNPLTMHVDEVNAFIDEFSETMNITLEESIAEVMVKLDESNTLTEEERQGVVAMYRLMHKVDKNQGRVASLLMNQGLEPTMDNLLSVSTYLPKQSQSNFEAGYDESTGEWRTKSAKSGAIRQALEEAHMSLKENTHRVDELLEQEQPVTKENLIEHYLLEEEVKDMTNMDDLNETTSYEQVKKMVTGLQKSPQFSQQVGELSLNNLQYNQSKKNNSSTTENLLRDIDDATDGLIAQGLKDNLKTLEDTNSQEALDQNMKETIENAEDYIIHRRNGGDNGAVMTWLQQLKGYNANKQEGRYQVPITIGDQVSNLDIFIVNSDMDNQNDIQGAIALDLQNLGQITGNLRTSGNDIHINLEVQNESVVDVLKEYQEQLSADLGEKGYNLQSFELNSRIKTIGGSYGEYVTTGF